LVYKGRIAIGPAVFPPMADSLHHFLRDGTPRLTWACHPRFPI
jgi:hypothetical protein